MESLKLVLILLLCLETDGLFLTGKSTVSVSTPVGDIVGTTETIIFDRQAYDVTKFLGIPYGEPPVGQNRFNRPVPKTRFSSPFSATDNGAACLQGQGLGTVPLNVSEDCLFLNVFLPGRSPRFVFSPIRTASADSVEFRGIRPRMYIEDLL